MEMKKLIFISLILFFTVPIFAAEPKLKLSFDDKPKTAFGVLQYTSWLLINVDAVCTFNSTQNYGYGELNPILEAILDYPEITFFYHTVVNLGIIFISNKLYKKNKFVSYAFLIIINVVKIYFIYDHIKDW